MFFDKYKILKRTRGNNLDKKLPTTISSPKKLDNLFSLETQNPKILKPKIN